MKMIDNGNGPTVMLGRLEGEVLTIRLKDIFIFGETEAKDCEVKDECLTQNHEGCIDKVGMLLPYFTEHEKDPMPNSTLALPMNSINSNALAGG